jgi:hypothetical protein
VDGFCNYLHVFGQKAVFLTRIRTLADYPQGKKTSGVVGCNSNPLGRPSAEKTGVVGATLYVA